MGDGCAAQELDSRAHVDLNAVGRESVVSKPQLQPVVSGLSRFDDIERRIRGLEQLSETGGSEFVDRVIGPEVVARYALCLHDDAPRAALRR